MTNPAKNSEDALKTLSRRMMLRNTAITATGAVLLPPFLTGCRKLWDFPHGHGGHGGGGVGGEEELTWAELAQAAANLTMLRQLMNESYQLAEQYDEQVFKLLNSTKTSSWANFDADILIDIAFLMAAALAVASGGAAAVPAIAFFSAMLHDWGIGKDRPNNLVDNFVEFELGRIAMQSAIADKLSHLVQPGDFNTYDNLVAAWKDPIDFNGQTYTLGNLARVRFTLGDEYNRLKDASLIHMKKAVWNLLTMKCCSYYRADGYWVTLKGDSYDSLVFHVRENIYSQHKGVYVRGYTYELLPGESGTFWIDIWNLGINGYPFPDLACDELFIDDVPNHTINEKGLFHRDYVFKQFSLTKPDFGDNRHDLADYDDASFSYNDDWDFTGGMFPKLIKP